MYYSKNDVLCTSFVVLIFSYTKFEKYKTMGGKSSGEGTLVVRGEVRRYLFPPLCFHLKK